MKIVIEITEGSEESDTLIQNLAKIIMKSNSKKINNALAQTIIQKEPKYSPIQIAEITGQSYRTVMRHIRSGNLKAIKGKKKYEISKTQLDEYKRIRNLY